MDVDTLHYELPEELIAQRPLPTRDASRMLLVDRAAGRLTHAAVKTLPEAFSRALFVLNDTRVIPARLLGHKSSGGKVELLLVERLASSGPGRERWLCLGKASKGLAPGTRVEFAHAVLRAEVLERRPQGLVVELTASDGVAAALEACGRMPLPPYIRRDANELDRERYQTVFAAHDGAVAAPTAGLHLSRELLSRLRRAGHDVCCVTLHVGPGTFAPLRLTPGQPLREHRLHAERFAVPETTARAISAAKAAGTPVVAVGTTVVRALESYAREHKARLAGAEGSTSLFVYPPFEFRIVDALLTNFHLPRSSLLALVMAFGGTETIAAAYREAVAARYRFYSYGDAMLIRG